MSIFVQIYPRESVFPALIKRLLRACLGTWVASLPRHFPHASSGVGHIGIDQPLSFIAGP